MPKRNKGYSDEDLLDQCEREEFGYVFRWKISSDHVANPETAALVDDFVTAYDNLARQIGADRGR
jgi:hypothetical protein